MCPNTNYWYRLLFKVKIYEASGDSFQNLVSQLYQSSFPNFQSISPWGNWGDGGNDGWIKEEQHYIQVYGPKPTTSLNVVEVINKVVNDFTKLRKKWGAIRKYSFVLNDRFTGVPAPISNALQKLEFDERLEQACAINSAKLETMFMDIAEDLRLSIVGGIPSCFIDHIEATAVGELLSNLADQVYPISEFLHDKNAPDFNKKILINGLSSPVTDYLRVFSYQTTLVDEFLFRRDSGLQQAISGEIRSLYNSSKNTIPDTETESANVRYVWMIERLIPDSMRRHPHSMKAYREAAHIILAKFFETCDAYEYTNSSPPA